LVRVDASGDLTHGRRYPAAVGPGSDNQVHHVERPPGVQHVDGAFGRGAQSPKPDVVHDERHHRHAA
jgi:hypothetical protein